MRRKGWQVDWFHIAFALIAMTWVVIAAGFHARLAVEMQENLRLRAICGVTP